MPDHLGKQFGHYRLTRLLGRGGFAEVYLGEHIYLHTHAALKLLHAHLAEAEAQRFLIEAQVLAGLEHPHIVPVHDFGVQAGVPYLVMQYAPHGSLRAVHPLGTRLPLATVISYMAQIASALHYAHERKLIHRDIKPENMLLGQHGLLLSDFGLAVTASSSSQHTAPPIAGTPTYMAPEQLRGSPSAASDQYALGVVVYEWLCGQLPFTGDRLTVAMQHCLASPPALRDIVLDLPPTVEWVVLKALAKDPRERFDSVMAFATALQQAMVLEEIPSQTSERRRISSRSHLQWRHGRLHQRPLIGREHELAALRHALQETQQRVLVPSSSIPPCFLLRGEPGIGKTRLVEEISQEASARGWLVIWSRAYHQEPGAPYQFWTQILRETLQEGVWQTQKHSQHALIYQPLGTLLPELADLFPPASDARDRSPEQEQLRLWETILLVLTDICERHPLLLVLDDLHCADRKSVELLGYVARRLGHAPLLFMGTYRDHELTSLHPLSALIAHLQREHLLQELSLAPLTSVQIAALVADTPTPFIQPIQQQAAGNPFFAEELALALQQEDSPGREGHRLPRPDRLPATITAVLSLRIQTLSKTCQQFLSHASIFGSSFAFSTLVAMERSGKTPIDEEMLLTALEEALQARILTEEVMGTSITYHFWHPLQQSYLYGSLSATRRALLHHQAAYALQQLHAAYEEEGAASIVYHLLRGKGTSQQIAYFAQLAGTRAYRLSSYAEAERYYVSALEHGERKPEHQAQRVSLLACLGECTRVQGKYDEARHYYSQALQIASELMPSNAPQQEGELQAMMWCEFGLTWFEMGDDRNALACYELGEQVLQQAAVQSGPAWARVRYEQGYVCWRQGNYEEARRKAFEALKLFEEVLQQRKHTAEYHGYTTGIQRSLMGDPVDLGRTYQLLGLISVCAGLSQDALIYNTRALTVFEAGDYQRGIAIVCCNLGDLYLRKAEHELAYIVLSRAQQVSERVGEMPSLSSVLDNLGVLAARTGDIAEAEDYYSRGLSLIAQGDEQAEVCWLSIHLAMSLQDQYRFVEAAEALRHSLVIGRRMYITPCIGAALTAIGRFRLAQLIAMQVTEERSSGATDERKRTLKKARKSLLHALAFEDIEVETRTEGHLLLAQVLLLQGELDMARQQIIYTIEDARKYELLPLIALAQRVLGCIQVRRGQYEQAKEVFEQALSAFRTYKMRLEQARTLQSFCKVQGQMRLLFSKDWRISAKLLNCVGTARQSWIFRWLSTRWLERSQLFHETEIMLILSIFRRSFIQARKEASSYINKSPTNLKAYTKLLRGINREDEELPQEARARAIRDGARSSRPWIPHQNP